MFNTLKSNLRPHISWGEMCFKAFEVIIDMSVCLVGAHNTYRKDWPQILYSINSLKMDYIVPLLLVPTPLNY